MLRAHVAGSIWPDASEERAAGNLRSGLWQIQRSLDGLVEASSSQVGLADDVTVDLRQPIECAHGLLNGGSSSDFLPTPEGLSHPTFCRTSMTSGSSSNANAFGS
jgi:hypothetical protein